MAEETTTTETEYKAGRPFLFTDPKQLDMKVQNYFDDCDPHIEKRQVENGYNQRGETIWMEREIMTDQKPYTVTGLALSLGVSRETLRNYRKYEHYSDDIEPETRQQLIATIEAAIQRVEAYNEMALHKNGISNGIKFNLTNNFGWVDKQVLETNTAEEDLDALDDSAEQRDDVANQAAKALEDQKPDQPPQTEEAPTNEEPGPAPTE